MATYWLETDATYSETPLNTNTKTISRGILIKATGSLAINDSSISGAMSAGNSGSIAAVIAIASIARAAILQ